MIDWIYSGTDGTVRIHWEPIPYSDCQDEPPPTAKTPEEADEILDRLGHG